MTREELNSLRAEWENAKVDFKREWYWNDNMPNNIKEVHKNELVKDLIALTNGDVYSIDKTAYLIIGIDDVTKEFYEFDKSVVLPLDKLKQQLLTLLNNYVQPEFLALEIELVDDVLVIFIPPRGSLISLSKDLKLKNNNTDRKGTTYYRVGEDIRVASSEVVGEFEKAFGNNKQSVSMTIHGDVKGVGIVQDGAVVNQNIILAEHKVSKQLTTTLGKSTLIGREKELQEIDERLKASNTLLVKGIGGVGKSTIASNYLHRHKDEYAYYGFFEGVESFISELREPLKLKEEKFEDAFMEALTKLRQLDGDKLLVIDDVKETKENKKVIERILGLQNNGYKILLTSCEAIEDVEQYYLDVLSRNDAKKLFNSIYPVSDEVLLEAILSYLDYHTFFVEKTAQTLKSKRTLTPEMIKEKFQNKEFTTIKRKRKEGFNDYLNQLFSFDELDGEEKVMLKQFSALPSIEIRLESLQLIFNKKGDEEFEEILNYLCEKGWLSFIANGYKLHQIIKEYVFYEDCPLFSDIRDFIVLFTHIEKEKVGQALELLVYFESLTQTLERTKGNDKQLEIDFFYKLGEIYSFLGKNKDAKFYYEKVIEIFESLDMEKNLNIIEPSIRLAKVYEEMGLYIESENLYLKLLEISEEKNLTEDIVIAHLYDGIGELYKELANYIESEKYFQKSLEIKIRLLKQDDYDITISYSLLAGLYSKIGDYQKAEFYYIEELRRTEKHYGKEHSESATSYNNLGLFYFSIKKYEQAENYYFKALEIYKVVFNEEHHLFATLYNNLGLLYSELANYTEAEKYFQKSLELREELLGFTHLRTEQAYKNLSGLYIKLEDYKQALFFSKKVCTIYSEINHPDLDQSKDSLELIEKLINGNLPRKMERNSLCYCGSGQKYKKCCLKKSNGKDIYIL